MNIFWLDMNLDKCVEYHCDKHVVKMIVEYTQLLSASSRLSGVEQGYKLSHSKHPDTLWLLESLDNWLVLYTMARKLCKEYTYRYGKDHSSYRVLNRLKQPNLKAIGVTEPPQCMPEQYKCSNFILAYRNYYIGEKARFATWRKRGVPYWFNYDERFLDQQGNTLPIDKARVELRDRLTNNSRDLLKRIKLKCNSDGFLNEVDRRLFIKEFNKLADIIAQSNDKISVYSMQEILKITKEIKLRIY